MNNQVTTTKRLPVLFMFLFIMLLLCPRDQMLKLPHVLNIQNVVSSKKVNMDLQNLFYE